MEFPTDRIERTGPGKQGADILQVVVHNGKDCGTLIYDSKNHGAWRNDFVSKLAVDQMATNQKRITNSKDLRKLRATLPDPVAKAQFLNPHGDIDSAMLRLTPPPEKKKGGLSEDLDSAVEAVKNMPWIALQELKGDPEFLNKIADAEEILRSLRKALS